MDMYGIIMKKKRGGELDADELGFIASGAADGSIPDAMLSAFLMAVCFQGMTVRETADFTLAMARTGEMAEFGELYADKHSSGGVGDKTTLVACPIAAACGLKIAKMSGPGLGHTGGTVDKLESLPGFRTELSAAEFREIVERTGICLAGHSGNLAPADRRIYALRDLTATADCVPLIASSIMSKKLASGAGAILLDVKYGSGAFVGSPEEAAALAELMVKIGNAAGRRCAAFITDMNTPLGTAVGNSLELDEAVRTLRGEGPGDLTELSLQLAAGMLTLAGTGREESLKMASTALFGGAALRKFREMICAQGGDPRYIDNPALLPKARFTAAAPAAKGGYILRMDAAAVGRAAALLGAGRERAGEPIDHAAGITLLKKTGASVKPGETVAVLCTGREEKIPEAAAMVSGALEIGASPPEPRPLIWGSIGVEIPR